MLTDSIGRWMRGLAVGALLAGCATGKPAPVSELLWPQPPETPRVKYLQTFATSEDLGKQKNWLEDVVLGQDPSRARRMAKPGSVTTDTKGRMYVTDSGVGRVWVFDRTKREVRHLGDSAPGLSAPMGVAVDGRGVVFVSDGGHKRVFGFDETGKVVMSIGKQDEFLSPAGIAIDRASGRLYVADTRRHRIRVYDTANGEFLFEMAQRGGEPGQFNFPTHVFVRNQKLYVSDTGNFRVQVLSLDGKFLRKYGELGANFGQLARPKGVAVDSEGQIYVVDAAFGNFQIFNEASELLLFVGTNGVQPGQFKLPAGIHIDEEDRIYVVDQYNARVQVFQYLGRDVELAKAASKANSK